MGVLSDSSGTTSAAIFLRSRSTGKGSRCTSTLPLNSVLSLPSAIASFAWRSVRPYTWTAAEARLCGLVERCRTLAAEFVLRRVICAGRRADGDTRRRGALPAEFRSGRILGLAPGTLHAGASKQPGRRRSEQWAEISASLRRGQERLDNLGPGRQSLRIVRRSRDASVRIPLRQVRS